MESYKLLLSGLYLHMGYLILLPLILFHLTFLQLHPSPHEGVVVSTIELQLSAVHIHFSKQYSTVHIHVSKQYSAVHI